MTQTKPTAYIHAKKSQWIPAMLAEYSLKKNSQHPDQFDTRILWVEDFPELLSYTGKVFRRDKIVIDWNVQDPQSFTFLRFAVPQLQQFEGRALVIDPDIFAVGDILPLLSMDMADKAIYCRKIFPNLKGNKPKHRPYFISSVMLMDCQKLKHWKWADELRELFDHKRSYQQWFGLRLENENTIGTLEDEWNHLDTLTPQTKLLHYTRRKTQPWMTTLPYDSYKGRNSLRALPKDLWVGLGHWCSGNGFTPYGRYELHPDPNQELFFLNLLNSALKDQVFSKKDLERATQAQELRPDIFNKLSSLKNP